MRVAQEPQQRGMRLRLRQAMQVEAGVDRLFAARDAPRHAAAKGASGGAGGAGAGFRSAAVAKLA